MKRKFYRIKSFSMPNNEETDGLLIQLNKIAKTDGWSFSKLVTEALNEYARRHGHGNPQTVLTRYDNIKKLKKLKGFCEMEGCKNKAEYMCYSAFPDGKDKRYCNRHRIDAERKRDIRSWKKL